MKRLEGDENRKEIRKGAILKMKFLASMLQVKQLFVHKPLWPTRFLGVARKGIHSNR
jgi:hypothetical protein